MFGSIRVLDGNAKLVEIAEMDHNKKNIDLLARKFEKTLGKITHKNGDSDCITIVTYEKGILGFSI